MTYNALTGSGLRARRATFAPTASRRTAAFLFGDFLFSRCQTGACGCGNARLDIGSTREKTRRPILSLLTGREHVVTLVLSRVRTLHAVGTEYETLGTFAYHAAVHVRARPSVAYAGHFLTLVDVCEQGAGERPRSS